MSGKPLILGMVTAVAGVILLPAAAHGAAPLPMTNLRQVTAASGIVGTNGTTLNVRSGPATDKGVVSTLADRTAVGALCQVWGEQITGTQRTTPYWLRLATDRYVSDAFVTWSPERPQISWCGAGAVDGVGAQVATEGSPLNVRSGPGTQHPKVSSVAPASALTIKCVAWGEEITGGTKTSAWAQLTDGNYVSDAFVRWSPQRPWLPWCGQEPPKVPPANSAGYITAAVAPAQTSQRSHRVPASVTIAQAILESGWGRSGLTRNDFNLFGMKCFGSPGPIALGCRDYGTTECNGSDCYQTRDEFRSYRNAADSFLDHGKQLAELSRYATAMRHTGDPDQFAREIHKAGYATSPTYADKLIGLMRQYNLYQYDVKS